MIPGQNYRNLNDYKIFERFIKLLSNGGTGCWLLASRSDSQSWSVNKEPTPGCYPVQIRTTCLLHINIFLKFDSNKYYTFDSVLRRGRTQSIRANALLRFAICDFVLGGS